MSKKYNEIIYKEINDSFSQITNENLVIASNDAVLENMYSDPKIVEFMESSVEIYNEKHGTNYTVKEALDHIQFISELSVSKKKEFELIKSDIISNISDSLKFKTVVVLASQLDKFLNYLSTQTMEGLIEENFVIIERLFAYISKLDEIKDKYYIQDINKLLTKSDNDKVSTEDKVLMMNKLKLIMNGAHD